MTFLFPSSTGLHQYKYLTICTKKYQIYLGKCFQVKHFVSPFRSIFHIRKILLPRQQCRICAEIFLKCTCFKKQLNFHSHKSAVIWKESLWQRYCIQEMGNPFLLYYGSSAGKFYEPAGKIVMNLKPNDLSMSLAKYQSNSSIAFLCCCFPLQNDPVSLPAETVCKLNTPPQHFMHFL